MSDMTRYLLSPADIWSLSLGAILLISNGARYETDYDFKRAGMDREEHRLALIRDWSIDSSTTLIETLHWLLHEGHGKLFNEHRSFITTLSLTDQDAYLDSIRSDQESYNRFKMVKDYHHKLPHAGIKAWDWGRYIFICQKGVFLQYISQAEALQLMRQVAILTQQAYSSWLDYSAGYFIGRQFWLNQLSGDKADELAGMVRQLLVDKHGPWRTQDWNIDLNQ